jgi:hypothetical protein
VELLHQAESCVPALEVESFVVVRCSKIVALRELDMAIDDWYFDFDDHEQPVQHQHAADRRDDLQRPAELVALYALQRLSACEQPTK